MTISEVLNICFIDYIFDCALIDWTYLLQYLQQDVQFTNNSQGATNYLRRFGNGDSTYTFNPIENYTQEGAYIVELVAENQFGCRDSIQQIFEIFEPPTGLVTYEQLHTCEPSLVQFYPNALNTTDYFWNFGNGQSSIIPEPIDVELIATNSYNCSDDTILSIRPDFFGTLEVPNIMAPNFGIGEDRFFIPKGIGLETYLVEVFDKQGTRVWYSKAIDADGRPSEQWDGKYQG